MERDGTAPPDGAQERPRRHGLARKVLVAGAGGTMVAVGVAMIVLPGPAIVLLPLGLGILATEFAWARRLLRRATREADRVLRRGAREPNN